MFKKKTWIAILTAAAAALAAAAASLMDVSPAGSTPWPLVCGGVCFHSADPRCWDFPN